MRFTCETCRQKHPKALAGYETVGGARARDEELVEDPDVLAVADEDAADDDVDVDVVDADVVIEEVEVVEEP